MSVSVELMNRIVSPALLACAAAVAVFCLPGTRLTIQAQSIKSMDYVVKTGGRIFVVINNQSALLKHELILAPDIKVMANGIIKVTGAEETELDEGRKMSLD